MYTIYGISIVYMYTIRNILYSIKKYRYVRMQWTFCKNIEKYISKKSEFT